MRNALCVSLVASLALLSGCKDQDPGSRVAPAGSATRTTGGSSDYAMPKRADNQLDQAKTAQDRADSANRDVAGASKDVLNAQEKLRSDEQKLGQTDRKDEQKLGEAQQNEARARTSAQAAQSDAQAAQSDAQQSVSGTIAQATSDEVRVDSANQPGMRLKLNGSTKITLDGKDISATQLQEGTQVRASYSVVGDQPTAVRIEAKSAPR